MCLAYCEVCLTSTGQALCFTLRFKLTSRFTPASLLYFYLGICQIWCMSACYGNRASPSPPQKGVRRGDLFFYLLFPNAVTLEDSRRLVFILTPFHWFFTFSACFFSQAISLEDLPQCFRVNSLTSIQMSLLLLSMHCSIACGHQTRAREVAGRFTPQCLL